MTAPMITATRTMDEMIKMITRLRVFRRNVCCSSSSTLPYPLKDLIVSIFDMFITLLNVSVFYGKEIVRGMSFLYVWKAKIESLSSMLLR